MPPAVARTDLRHRRLLAPALPLALAAALLPGCSSAEGPAQGPAAPPGTAGQSQPPQAQATAAETDKAFADLEARYGARLGVYAVDTGTGRTATHRAGERFAFASTLKALSAGVLLDRETDAGLDEVVRYSEADLLSYAPVTSKNVATGMRVRDLVAAALQQSDNTAQDLVLARLGGPDAVEEALRDLGDGTTNVDRDEPALNSATPGDPRDTTTPEAIARDLQGFVLGDVLPPARRQLLTDLMLGNTTGGPYVRAGVPAGWQVADKTGNGGYGTRNDVAVAYPPGGSPVVIALLSDRGSEDAVSDDALLADATRTVVAALD